MESNLRAIFLEFWVIFRGCSIEEKFTYVEELASQLQFHDHNL